MNCTDVYFNISRLHKPLHPGIWWCFVRGFCVLFVGFVSSSGSKGARKAMHSVFPFAECIGRGDCAKPMHTYVRLSIRKFERANDAELYTNYSRNRSNAHRSQPISMNIINTRHHTKKHTHSRPPSSKQSWPPKIRCKSVCKYPLTSKKSAPMCFALFGSRWKATTCRTLDRHRCGWIRAASFSNWFRLFRRRCGRWCAQWPSDIWRIRPDDRWSRANVAIQSCNCTRPQSRCTHTHAKKDVGVEKRMNNNKKHPQKKHRHAKRMDRCIAKCAFNSCAISAFTDGPSIWASENIELSICMYITITMLPFKLYNIF